MVVLIELGMGMLLFALVAAAIDEVMNGRAWRRGSLADTQATPIRSGDAAERADDAAA